MQVMPRTGKVLAEKKTGRKGRPKLRDPRTNISLGIDYLKHLDARYKGNRFLVLSAYNWGPGNIHKAQKGKKKIPKSVKKYANQIMERTLRWQKHFERARGGATRVHKKAKQRAEKAQHNGVSQVKNSKAKTSAQSA